MTTTQHFNSSKQVQLSFGLDENNKSVHVSQVVKGKNCNCVCACCRSPLVAVQGIKRQYHFRHVIDNECKGGFESSSHLATKQLIIEKRQITLPKCVIYATATDSRGKTHNTEPKTVVDDGKIINFDSVQEEVVLEEMRPDIIAKKDNIPLIIEIYYRHKVDEEKLKKIHNAKISAIEIDISDLKQEDAKDWETLWSYINNPQHVKWLYNVKGHLEKSNLEKIVAKKIEKQEVKYKQEETEKQQRIEKEKRELSKASDELKILSSKEHIDKLKQEAETHLVWKQNIQYLSCSLNELPNFLNIDIGDGDWIFECDRRIWQSAFYISFICKSKKSFSINQVNAWLNNNGFKVHLCVEIVKEYGRRYPELVPTHIRATLLSSLTTLRLYCDYLCKLGILKYISNGNRELRNDWYKVVSKNSRET